MAGYDGYSMSNNAREAYSDGQRPLSRWTKEEILDCLDEQQVEFAKKLTLTELRDELLDYAGWHHTSKHFNETKFYAINADKAEELTSSRVEEIISQRKPRTRNQDKEEPKYVTALVRYTEWEGSRNHPRAVEKEEVVTYMSDDKMVKCAKSNNWQKRLSNLTIVYKVEQKTKYASSDFLMKKFKKKEQEDIKKRMQERKIAEKELQEWRSLCEQAKKILNSEKIECSLSGNIYRYREKPTSREVEEGTERVTIIDKQPRLQQYREGKWTFKEVEAKIGGPSQALKDMRNNLPKKIKSTINSDSFSMK